MPTKSPNHPAAAHPAAQPLHPVAGGARGHLAPGQVPPRPPRNKSQAHGGVHPVSSFAQGSQKFQPLPDPLGQPPYHYDLESIIPGIGQQASDLGKIVFHTVGDTGGIKNPTPQSEVARLMKGDLNLPEEKRPRFFYHLGDVVYYNGQIDDYYDQFYQPYSHYDAPIIAIPGNHDGDPINSSQTSLDGFVAYFMTSVPRINPESHDEPRATMSQPNVYFTLNCPFVTIVGMYTNVPEHGSIDSIQQQWLTHEFATAPMDKALILALHHPVYSFDDHHSGSPRMADAVQHAINDSRRVPNMVLCAHVHNYQKIEKQIAGAHPTPFLVLGNGGYYHMHGINIVDQKKEGTVDPDTGAKLVAFNETNHGYATLTVDAHHISGVVTTIDEAKHNGAPSADTFTYPAGPLLLPEGATISL
jgi:hypothetical protein